MLKVNNYEHNYFIRSKIDQAYQNGLSEGIKNINKTKAYLEGYKAGLQWYEENLKNSVKEEGTE